MGGGLTTRIKIWVASLPGSPILEFDDDAPERPSALLIPSLAGRLAPLTPPNVSWV